MKNKELGIAITKGTLADSARMLGKIHGLSNEDLFKILLDIAGLFKDEPQN